MAAGRAGRVAGRQLGDDLPGYHQPLQLVLSFGELLAQQFDLAGQLGDPAGDPFASAPSRTPGYLLCEQRWTQTITGSVSPAGPDTPDMPKRVK